MPTDVEQIAHDDYEELEIAHGGQSPKVSETARLAFKAAVKLDLKRREPIGLQKLFAVWLKQGNRHWLNPLDKNRGLGALEEILFKYQGDITALCPFVTLLTELAGEGISPRSFVEYVILPRMGDDNNWRKWRENHLEAVQIIANLINKIKEQAPFNKEHLGSGRTRLARDIVLVRYIGRPLALFQLSQLRDNTMLGSYCDAWQKISLQDPLSLYFMRNNALHFIYSMSGKIDLIQLIAIIEQLPDIERAFITAFPGGVKKLENIKAMNLYDYDIDMALQSRRQRGFHSLDFALEIRAYFNIVKALLEKSTGVYLCAYYAGLLKSFKDPVIAETMSRLVHVIDDRGGMYIYKWHTKKLLAKRGNVRQAYIDFIETHHGCDPEYPEIRLLFRDEEIAFEARGIFDLAADLGLANYFIGPGNDGASYKKLLDVYVQEHPDTTESILDYQQQLLAGQDRQWTKKYTQQLDMMGAGKLFSPLLRSVIRGMGIGWMYDKKSSCFSELLDKYGMVHSQKEIAARTRFDMPIKQIGSTPADRDTLARRQINLESMEKTWHALSSSEPVSANNTMQYLNKWNLELVEPLKKAYGEKVAFEESMRKAVQESAAEQVIDKLEKDIAKREKTIQALQDKEQQYANIMKEFDSLNDEQKFIAALILAGAEGKSDEQFTGFTTGLLLQRYRKMDSVASRLHFLIDDLSVDVMTYQQLIFLLNLLETLFFLLREDTKIINLLEADDTLQDILTPYLITKKKQITLDALDAAAKKMTGYAAMQAERAKWQGILVKLEEKDEKYFHSMEIYTSKSFIDSHYGDMGGICLSVQPRQIERPGFYVQRLADHTDRQIIGMSILYLSNRGFSSDQTQAENFWQAFAFNPLSSVLSHFTQEQQLYLYLQYRLNMEKVSWMTKMPVVLSGIETSWGLISNNACFGSIITGYELNKPTAQRVYNAKGLSVYYSEKEFANALVIIDPRGYEKAEDPSLVPTFYASRELESFFQSITQ